MENKNILITGASGIIGTEVIRGLEGIRTRHRVIACGHSIEKTRNILSKYSVSEYRKIDFSDARTFQDALKDIDVVFLLRPPHLADVKKYFAPFVMAMKQNQISQVVFLSVMGAESQPFIPHHKIERLIMDAGLDYVFLRPGYFMQNLTSTLVHEILHENRIYVPSGNLKMHWIDALDIGLAGAHVLNDFEKFRNQGITLTGSEFMGFAQAAGILSDVVGRPIHYKSPSLLQFYLKKRKQGIPDSMILVMIMLHYLPRFGSNTSKLNNRVKEITGKDPETIRTFSEREKERFEQ